MTTTTIELPVFVPKAGTWLHRSVAPKSAVVGERMPNGEYHVYYEGNIYNAQNIKTFADRAMIAHWRLRDRYPTIAQAVVQTDDVIEVGTLRPDLGVVTVLPANADALRGWLEIASGGLPELDAECRTVGVRV